MQTKTIQDSSVDMSMVMLPHQANVAGNVHGGEIMKLMDSTAGVVAYRHARTNVVTARVDELIFHQPIYVGNLVNCHAHLTFVGKSSMEISVIVEVENLLEEDSRKCALTGLFTMVALNRAGGPSTVPTLKLTSDKERALFEEGKQRYEANKAKVKTCTIPGTI